MKLKPIKLIKKRTNYKGLSCLNCGQPLAGNENFCSHCGQKNTTKKLSFGVFLDNMASNFYSYDSRFWRTFIPLLTAPGYVSKMFIEGKRMRFVNPFQLYLNVSLIFFLVLGIHEKFNDNSVSKDLIKISSDNDSLKTADVVLDSIISETKLDLNKKYAKDTSATKIITNLDTLNNFLNKKFENDNTSVNWDLIEADTLNTNPNSVWRKLKVFQDYYKENKDVTTAAALDSLGYEPTFWNKFYYQRVVDSYSSLQSLLQGDYKSFSKRFFSKISIALFLFLPVFTLFLWLLYIRRGYTYMEHLVFVFNTQTVFFLLLTIFYVLNFIVPLSSFWLVFIILFLLYLYKALRKFYGQGRIKTFIKFMILNIVYFILGLIGIVIVSIIAFAVI